MKLRTSALLLVLIAVGLGLFSAPAFAADAGAEKSKIPPMFQDIQRYDLGVWTLVVFGLLFLILYLAAWPKILDGLEKRELNIRAAKEAAEQAKADAEKLQIQLKEQLAKANDEIRAMMDEARRDAAALKEQIKADAAKEIQLERERLQTEITTARDQALQEIWNQAVQVAMTISTKAIRKTLDFNDHQRLLQEALAELQQSTNLVSKA